MIYDSSSPRLTCAEGSTRILRKAGTRVLGLLVVAPLLFAKRRPFFLISASRRVILSGMSSSGPRSFSAACANFINRAISRRSFALISPTSVRVRSGEQPLFLCVRRYFAVDQRHDNIVICFDFIRERDVCAS
jgi:hypothetical protein